MDRKSKAGAKPEAGATPVRSGAEGLLDDLKSTRRDLLSARHPAYHRVLGTLLTLLSGPDTDEELAGRFERAWRSRSFPTFYERPLLILAALRADALQEGSHHPLFAALAAAAPDPDVVTAETLKASLGRGRLGVWSTMTTRRVQTNDTSRAVTWMWPAHLAGCDGRRRPLALVDIGAAAGLNLVGDQLPNIWSDRATGMPIPCVTDADVVARLGFDARPLHLNVHDDVLWMRACIWPGETERLSRFEASVQAMRGAGSLASKPVIERVTASLVPKRLGALLASTPLDAVLLAYHTLVSGYLETTERESYRNGMMDLLAREEAGRVLWAELELDDSRRRFPAVLIAHVRAGDGVKSLRVGRSSQHPKEIEVDVAGLAELRRILATG